MRTSVLMLERHYSKFTLALSSWGLVSTYFIVTAGPECPANSINTRTDTPLFDREVKRSGSVCLNNFPRTISGALGVHNGAELSTAAVGACDVPADAVGNSGRTSKSHSMQPLPVLAGWHSRPRLAFGPADWNVVVRRCTSQCGLRSVFSHQPRWHRRACTHART